LITTIAPHWIEAGNSSSWPNIKKHNENNAREACQFNLYPIANHENYKL
jgi:hypothetical protein